MGRKRQRERQNENVPLNEYEFLFLLLPDTRLLRSIVVIAKRKTDKIFRSHVRIPVVGTPTTKNIKNTVCIPVMKVIKKMLI